MFQVWSQFDGCDDCQLGNIPLTGFTNAGIALSQAQQAANQIASAQKWSAIMNTISAATTAAATALSRARQTEPPPNYIPATVPTGQQGGYVPAPNAGQERERPEKVEAVTWSEDGLTIFGTTLSPVVLLGAAGALYLLFKEPPKRGGRG